MPVYQNKGTYLFVEPSEPYSLHLILTMVQEIADHCQKEDLHKVLVDLTQMEGNPNILDRYTIGVEVARICGATIQGAAIAKQSITNYMVENVAVNRGAKLKVVSTFEEAMKWLELKNRSARMSGSE
jgi:hypothetical protein